MAHPKRQHSKQRSRKRRTHQKLKVAVSDFKSAGSREGFQHKVDPITGCYKGKQVVQFKEKAEAETPETEK